LKRRLFCLAVHIGTTLVPQHQSQFKLTLACLEENTSRKLKRRSKKAEGTTVTKKSKIATLKKKKINVHMARVRS
jgi:hypothetical protein